MRSQYPFCYICRQREKTSTHLFPKSSARRKLWLNAFNLSEYAICKNTRVCGKHFEQDSFHPMLPGCPVHLKRDAIPTLLLERRFSRLVYSQKRGNTTEKTMNGESELTVACSPRMKNLVCSLCGLEFSEERHLSTHIKICKNGENPTDPLGADTCSFEYVDCTQVCQNQVDRVEITDVEIFRSEDLLDEHNIKCETPELTCDEKSEEIECTEPFISDTYTGQPIVHLKTETPEEQIQCDYEAVQSGQLEEHNNILKKQKQLQRIKEIQTKCTICDYVSAYSLTRHMRTHTGEKPFKCAICDNAYSECNKLTRHMKIHTGEKPFKCSECDYSGVSRSYLTVHMRKHTGEKPFKCTVCDNAFAERGNLKQHMKNHTGEKPFKCTFCDYASTRRALLTCHMHTHAAEKPFKCSVCDYSGADSYKLMLHMRRHTGEKPFKCTICDYTCTQRGYLTYHMQSHAAEKQFKCTVCDYACGRKTRLREHMITHMKKQFPCTLCDYSGTDRYKLIHHMKRHAGDKRFICAMCDYSCTRRNRLREHITRKHIKKQFQCTLCEYSSARNSELLHHNLLMHGICENVETESI